jgi:outer membrane protein OmpA-like peptidoglycan-associated protein
MSLGDTKMRALAFAAGLLLAVAAVAPVHAQSGQISREQMLQQLTQDPGDDIEIDCRPGSPQLGTPACERRGFSLPGARPSGTAPAPSTRPAARPAPTTAARPAPARRPAANYAQAAARCDATEVSGGGLNLCVTFALGSAQLNPSSRASLDTLASILNQELSSRSVVIEGHADASGRADLNRTLSRQRAEAVVRYLAGKGVAASRLQAVGHGSDRPIAGRAPTDPMNRRVQARLGG